ncbi:hypothetical protein [Erythrobacter colymbi]|uniref:hypothetical protein n=1 Tax=Erythrobacter colymbi TaxID=1161202 RepID=UPI00117D0E94|nr:hypothetical protein [Erythrobacter colymbi]
MAQSETITSDWLADRAALHDAIVVSAHWAESTLKIEIDDEWPNLLVSEKNDHNQFGGWLVFEGAQIIHGNLSDVLNRYVNELKFDDGMWSIYFARKSLVSKRSLLTISAESAAFEPRQRMIE